MYFIHTYISGIDVLVHIIFTHSIRSWLSRVPILGTNPKFMPFPFQVPTHPPSPHQKSQGAFILFFLLFFFGSAM